MKLTLFVATLVSVSLASCSTEEPCGCVPPPHLEAGESCGAASCDEAPPACLEGGVPVIDASGCYTGACKPAWVCDVPPPCDVLKTEAECTERAECAPVYGGLNCRDPQGNTCDASGEASTCSCEAFVFARCDQAAS